MRWAKGERGRRCIFEINYKQVHLQDVRLYVAPGAVVCRRAMHNHVKRVTSCTRVLRLWRIVSLVDLFLDLNLVRSPNDHS